MPPGAAGRPRANLLSEGWGWMDSKALCSTSGQQQVLWWSHSLALILSAWGEVLLEGVQHSSKRRSPSLEDWVGQSCKAREAAHLSSRESQQLGPPLLAATWTTASISSKSPCKQAVPSFPSWPVLGVEACDLSQQFKNNYLHTTLILLWP